MRESQYNILAQSRIWSGYMKNQHLNNVNGNCERKNKIKL